MTKHRFFSHHQSALFGASLLALTLIACSSNPTITGTISLTGASDASGVVVQLNGPINATAPRPVTNREFSRALGRALHRPAFMPAPAFALRLALGEMADALLLSGQRAVPAKAEHLGFRFRYPLLDEALGAIFT